MILTELFNRVADYTVIQQSNSLFKVEFQSGGETIRFKASKYNIDPNYDENNEDDTETYWEVNFGLIDKETGESDFTLNGRGNEFLIMATIKAIMHEFFSSYKPYCVIFLSDKDESSRTSLYAKMCRKYVPANYKTVVDDDRYQSMSLFKIIKTS